MKQKMVATRFFTLSLILAVLLVPGLALAELPEFHINPGTDTMEDTQAQGFQNQSIASVTAVLGSPSMVRDNPTDPSLRDYIYIGNQTVYIFSMNREGKTVAGASKHTRGEWDGGLYATYGA